MLEGLVFGWRSAFLLAVLLPVMVLAGALAGTMRNRLANRTLAALLIVLAGIATPWMIGFSGFYDRWQWLSYAPFSINLAVPPLLWFFTHALATGRWPVHAGWHLAPGVAQAVYKVSQVIVPYQPTVGMILDASLAVSAWVYGTRSLTMLARYRLALAEVRSDDARYAAHWLSRAVVAVLILLVIALAYKIAGTLVPLGYEGSMGLYIAVSLFALYLGIEGWRHATLEVPVLAEGPHARAQPVVERDWQAFGEQIAARTREESWDIDPELTLGRLARLLGTNTSYLSRALNEGLGVSFSKFVNGLRSERVASAMKDRPDATVLELALEAGFASKATFNRAFAARYGCSPSDWRKRLKN